MQCKCGSEMTYSVHVVTSVSGKEKWVDKAPIEDLEIQQWDCKTCERHRHVVSDYDKVIKEFG